MESLALMVCIIFGLVIFLGPFSLVLNKIGLKKLSYIPAVLSIIFGIYWIFVTPFPVSAFGCIGIITGIKVIKN